MEEGDNILPLRDLTMLPVKPGWNSANGLGPIDIFVDGTGLFPNCRSQASDIHRTHADNNRKECANSFVYWKECESEFMLDR
jgi:hypothetical protein